MIYNIHSKDYKKIVIEYNLKHGSLRKTSALFRCSTTTLYNWIVKDINKIRRKDRKKLYSGKLCRFIVNFTIKNVIPTLQQIQYAIKQKYKVSPSLTYIFYVLKNNYVTRKRLVKKYFPAKKKNIEKDLLKQFYKNVQKYNYKKIICIDETAVYVNMLLAYGRSIKGKQALKRTNVYPYKKFNLIMAMTYNKIIGWKLDKKSYDSTKLCKFIDDNLKKYSKHLLIFDNAIFHKSKKVIETLEKYNIDYQYIVPYHPENNPIERLISQLKSYLKSSNFQSFDEINNGIKTIIKSNIKSNNLKNYIKTLYYT